MKTYSTNPSNIKWVTNITSNSIDVNKCKYIYKCKDGDSEQYLTTKNSK